MPRLRLPRGLGARLNFLLAVLLGGLGLATGLVVLGGFERSEANASDASRAGIENFGESTVGTIAVNSAINSDIALHPLEQITRTGTAFVLSARGDFDTPNIELTEDASGARFLADPERRADVWLPAGVEMGAIVERDIELSAPLDLLLPQELVQHPETVAAYFISPSGLIRYYPPVGLHELASENFDPRESRAYQLASPDRNPARETVWSAPFEDPVRGGMLISTAMPVYEGDRFAGVIGVDVALSSFVAGVDASHPTENGYAFVILSDGKLLPSNSSQKIESELNDPANASIGRVLAAMRAGQAGTERLVIGDADVVVGYAPLESVDGSFAVVVPIADIAEQAGVSAVTRAISNDGRRTLLFVGLTSVSLFVIALALAWWLNKRFLVNPIGALAEATRSVAAGDLDVVIRVRRRDEIGQLASSFNDMTRTIASREAQLRAETIEREAAQRELQALFSAMSDVVVVLDGDGKYIRIAPSNVAALRRDASELIGRNIRDFYPAEQAEEFARVIRAAIDEQKPQTIEYKLPSSDDWFLGAVSPMGHDRVVWVGRDITERVHARRLLEQRVEERTRELSTLIRASGDLTSRIELETLIPALLDQLHALVPYDGSSAAVVEGEQFLFLDSRALGRREDQIVGLRMMARRFGVIWKRLERGEAVIIDDAQDETLEARAFRDAVGPRILPQLDYIRSWMAIPMRARGHIVGVLSLSRQEPGYFEEKHANIVSAFANFAGIAIDNARLFDEAQLRIRQNTSLAALVRNITLGLPLEDMLNRIASDVIDATGYMGASIILGQRHAPYFRIAGSAGLPQGFIPAMAESWSRGAMLVSPQEVADGQPIIVKNARQRMLDDPRFQPLHSTLQRFEYQGSITAPFDISGQLAGSLNVYFAPGVEPTPEDIDFLRAMSTQVSIILTNADLYNQAESRARDLEVILSAADRLSSTLELEPLVEIAMDQLSLIAPHDGEGVYLVEEGRAELYTRSTRDSAAINHQSIPIHGAGEFMERLFRGEVILIDDVRGSGRVPGLYQEWVRTHSLETLSENIRSFLAVPLFVSGRVIGAIGLSANTPAAFEARHRRLAQGIAYQMAVAFENARLFSETLERERENRALASVASALALDEPFEKTLEAISRSIVESTPAVACSVTLLNGSGDYVQGSGWGMPEGFTVLMAKAVDAGAPSAAHEVARSGKSIVIRRMRSAAEKEPLFKDIVPLLESSNLDNAAVVPLPYRGRTVGTISTFYTADTVPTEHDVALLNAIAGQASFAVENARLFAETLRREREMRALASVSAALALDQPLATTLDAIARNIVESTEAVAASLTLIDEQGTLILSGVAGLPPGFASAVTDSIELEGAHSAPHEVQVTGRPQVHFNLRQWFKNHPNFQRVAPFIDKVEWDNCALVPLPYRGRNLGTLTVFYEASFVPGDEELALLSAIANQATFAMENARLFTETGQRATEMEALYRADEALHRSLDLQHVFEALVDVATQVLNCDRSSLLVWDASRGRFELRAHRNFEPAIIELFQSLPPEGTLERSIQGELVAVDDVSREPGASQRLIEAMGISAFMHVPITIAGRVYGVFNLDYFEPHRFSSEERRLCLALSQRAAVAIQNAELYGQAQQAALLEERQRIARDLHDSVSQALYGIGLGAKTARMLLEQRPESVSQPLDYITELAEAGLAELRALIFELRPDSLATDGLVAALERQVAATRARYKLDVDARFIPEPSISLDAKEAIYRVAQEAMINAVKHARASKLEVNLSQQDGIIALAVADNGVGFDPNGEFPGHMGLLSMRERTVRLGGTLAVSSAPGEGTRVEIELPLEA